MSHITDIILTTAPNDSGILAIQYWLFERGIAPMANVSEYAGGNKRMTACVWLASINYLGDEGFFKIVKEAPWQCPDAVSLFMRKEGVMAFDMENLT
jgi:hypothetical protein